MFTLGMPVKCRAVTTLLPYLNTLLAEGGGGDPWPEGHVWPRMAMNADQNKIVRLLKTFFLLINFC